MASTPWSRAYVDQTRWSNWQTSQDGEREVREAMLNAQQKVGHEPKGELHERAIDYVAKRH